MTRKIKDEHEIRAEVYRLIHESAAVKEDREEVHVPWPKPRVLGGGVGGCNWTMTMFGNASAYKDEVSWALAAVQAKWNLSRPESGDVKALSERPAG